MDGRGSAWLPGSVGWQGGPPLGSRAGRVQVSSLRRAADQIFQYRILAEDAARCPMCAQGDRPPLSACRSLWPITQLIAECDWQLAGVRGPVIPAKAGIQRWREARNACGHIQVIPAQARAASRERAARDTRRLRALVTACRFRLASGLGVHVGRSRPNSAQYSVPAVPNAAIETIVVRLPS